MPAVRWYKSLQPPLQSTQGPCHQIQRPQLSQEACAAIKEHHLNSQLKYNSAIVKAVSSFGKAASDVALTHHKGLCHIKQDIHLSSNLIRKHYKKSNAWNAWFGINPRTKRIWVWLQNTLIIRRSIDVVLL